MYRCLLTLVFLGSLPFVLLLGSCSSSEENTPTETETPPLAEETVGAAGGTIESDDMVITIPAGVFEDDVELELHLNDTDPLGDDTITDTYRLEGLPANTEGPLEIRLRYSGELSGHSSVAVGWLVEDEENQTEWMDYTFLAAADSGGFLYAVLDETADKHAHSISGPSKSADHDAFLIMYFMGITGYTQRFVPPPPPPAEGPWHYWVFHDQSIESRIDGVIDMLEEVYSTYQDQGFDFSWEESPLRDIQVNILHTEEDDLVDAHAEYDDRSLFGNRIKNYKLTFSESLLLEAAAEDLLVATANEFALLVMTAHTHNRCSYWNWYRHALGGWAEGLFTSEDDHLPKDYEGKAATVLSGLSSLLWSIEAIWTDYLLSSPALIKYLVEEYGDQIPALILDAERGDIHHPAAAIASAVTAPAAEWWPHFVKALLNGDLYTIQTSEFLDAVSGSYTFADADDTETTFTEDYPDWSAKMFRIDLEDENFDSSANLRFFIESEFSDDITEILLYGLVDGQRTFYARGDDIILTDIDALQEAATDLLVVVCNANANHPYEEKNEITLTVERVESLDYNLVSGAIRYHAFLEGGNEIDWKVFAITGYSGTMAGNTFTANWNINEEGVITQGNFQCTLNSDHSAITNWSYDNRRDWTTPDTYDIWQASGTLLPFVYESETYLRFYDGGPDICDYITHLYFIRVDEGDVYQEHASHICDADSYVEIYLRVQE